MKNNFGISKSFTVAPLSGFNNWDAKRHTKDRNLVFVGNADDSKKEMTSFDRRELLRFSRYLAKNTGVVKGAINDMALYSIGSGMTAQAKTLDEKWNDMAESRFNEWEKMCDYRNLFNLPELCSMWSKAIDTDGDVFVVLTEDENGIPKLQTIGAHRVYKNDESNRIFDGVKLDANDRPIYYVIDEDTKIFTRDIIHLFDAQSADGVRAAPSTSHAINNMFDVREILALEKKGVKLNSAIATVIKSASPTDSAGFLGQQSTTTTDGQATTLESILGGGVIPRLKAGEDITSFTSSRPSPTFDGFIEHFIRDFAVGIGLPIEFIWNSEKMGGTAQRFILEKAQRRFEQRQQTIAKGLNRLWGWYVSKQIKAGYLTSNDKWYSVEFQPPKSITVDAGRDSKSTIEEIKFGIGGYKSDFGSRGKDWRVELRQKAIEEAYIDSLATEFKVDASRISQRTPNMNEITPSQNANTFTN